jgi:heterodisulfide reductase subunit B
MQGDGNETINLIAPCSGCYLVLSKAQRYLSEYRPLGDKIIDAMQNTGLNYTGKVRIRHPLDVLVNDVGLEKISSLVKRSLGYLRVACYYGCQIMRPYATFDDQHEPNTMNRLMQVLGAETISWPLSTRCCGGSLTGTFDKVGLRLNYILLKDAVRRGANVIATACPLCQFNLESYQTRIGRQYKDDVTMPIAYFTQIIGSAMGIAERRLGMRRLSVPPSLSAAGDVVGGVGNVGK